MIPNVPVTLNLLRLTMTSISLPPIPTLNTDFITDNTDIAIWDSSTTPDLICLSESYARSLNCTLRDDCTCNGAENSVHCECSHNNVEEHFHQLNKQLPVKTPAWEIRKRADGTVQAKILQMVSADFMIEFNQTIDSTTTLVQNSNCVIPHASIEGCYHCEKGAFALVSCQASSNSLAEIVCQQHSFVIPCGPTPVKSDLAFHLDSARQIFNCSVTCGDTVNHFTISGILKYVNEFHGTFKELIKGNTTNYREIRWPDLNHITDIILGWYKTLICSLILVIAALGLSYLFLQTMGWHVLKLLTRIALALLCLPLRLICRLGRCVSPNTCPQDEHYKTL
ncbi:unnamed protein product [Nippostrongylus brasiliensis]|uniref:Phlebovirus_G2 domain-containing protein n=1 Tax=Nippostrongylus brasiliensis TaxID=27835 RepID=A0A0N4XDE6_NIPBR|nr:unnamed protein product [Nippostrongylus brasiliensis]